MRAIPFIFFGFLLLLIIWGSWHAMRPARNERKVESSSRKQLVEAHKTIHEIENMTRSRMDVYGSTAEDNLVLDVIRKYHANKEIAQ